MDYLRDLSREDFAVHAAVLLSRINTIHAFREGNGRTQRLFLRQLAATAGHTLDFAVVSRDRLTQASIAAHERGDNDPMRRLFDEISNPHCVAALQPAIDFLSRMNFPWNDHYLATMEPGHLVDVTIAGTAGPHFIAHTASTILVGQTIDLLTARPGNQQSCQIIPSPWPDPDNANRPSTRRSLSPGI
jgi:cell filamentation protein